MLNCIVPFAIGIKKNICSLSTSPFSCQIYVFNHWANNVNAPNVTATLFLINVKEVH